MNDDIEAIETTIPKLESFYSSYGSISTEVVAVGDRLRELNTSTTSSGGISECRAALKVKHHEYYNIICIVHVQIYKMYVYTSCMYTRECAGTYRIVWTVDFLHCTCTCTLVQFVYANVHVPPEAAHFSYEKCLPWVCCVALPCCLFDLACFFLPSFSSLIETFICTVMYM